MIQIEPSKQGAVTLRDHDCLPSSTYHGGEDLLYTRALFPHCGHQSSRYFNKELEEMYLEAFLFMVDHANPKRFQKWFQKTPHFVLAMLKEAVADDVESSDSGS